MKEKRYILYDRNIIVARWISFENALLFIQAYYDRYFSESISFTMEEESVGE